MSRFYAPRGSIKGNRIILTGLEAHHVLDVMRLKTLDKVVAFDGTGTEYIGFIKGMGRKSVDVEIVERRTPLGKENCKITLIQAIPKKDSDYIMEKATELGVHSVIPVFTKRTIVSWNEGKRHSRVERWRRIAREASKQCGRPSIPKVDDIKDFKDALKSASDSDLNLIAALSDPRVDLKDAIRDFKGGKVQIAIGPEGDFTPDEIKKAKDARFIVVSLGRNVLKSDTAGLAVLAIFNY